jgi:predicted O-linked N-acetylglucosamine transferase (SPINDLY family)
MAKKKTKNTGQKLSLRKQKPLSPKLAQKLQLAYSFHQKGDVNLAKETYESILAERPNHAETNFLLGLLISHAGYLEQSEVFLSKAVKANPSEPRYLVGFGILLLKLDKFIDAANFLQKAVKIAPNEIEAVYNFGTAQYKLNRSDEAIKYFNIALNLNAEHLGSLNNMGNAQLALCNIETANSFYLKAHKHNTKSLSLLSDILINYNYYTDLSPTEVYQNHKQAAAYFPCKKTKSNLNHKPNNKIKIAYISADFRVHSVANFLLPLIKNHNRDKFEIYCFYNGRKVDQITLQFEALSDHWEMVSSISDEKLIKNIEHHNIDILVDLAGHTANNRLAVFSQRAAPIQITWLGYPHSTGLQEMDIRLIDDITDPSKASVGLSSEKLVRLPNGFLCYEGDESIPYQKTPPSIDNHFITFGSFNNVAKLNVKVIRAWAEILSAVPGSRLIIKSRQFQEISLRERYLGEFKELGINPERITLLELIPSVENHLLAYNQIDIALDSFPYNGTTTTCEAMWMGVPTITFIGDRHAARVSASIMTHSGFKELIAKDLNAYKSLAVNLAKDTDALIKLRSNMRERMKNSDLCNAKKFTANMEQAFQDAVISETPN